MIQLTTDEEYQDMKAGSKTISVIGMVCTMEAVSKVPSSGCEIFKFTLANGEATKVSCSVWGNNIPLFHKIIKLNATVFIKNAQSILVKNEAYNRGNLKWELVLKRHTTVKVLVECQDPALPADMESIDVLMKDVANYEGKLVRIQGWIKSPFAQLVSIRPYSTYGCGAIMDGKFCLEIHIAQFDPQVKFEEDCHVKVCGIVEPGTDKVSLHLRVAKMSNIAADNTRENVDEFAVLKGVKTPERKRKAEDEDDLQLKKPKNVPPQNLCDSLGNYLNME